VHGRGSVGGNGLKLESWLVSGAAKLVRSVCERCLMHGWTDLVGCHYRFSAGVTRGQGQSLSGGGVGGRGAGSRGFELVTPGWGDFGLPIILHCIRAIISGTISFGSRRNVGNIKAPCMISTDLENLS